MYISNIFSVYLCVKLFGEFNSCCVFNEVFTSCFLFIHGLISLFLLRNKCLVVLNILIVYICIFC